MNRSLNQKTPKNSSNIDVQASSELSTFNLSAASDNANFSQSDALSFASFRKGEVDPRTGSFNYFIPIARLTGNQQRGPSIELSLRHNHFSNRNEGFGKGWSLGLSKFFKDNSRMKLLLRDGRVVDLKLTDNIYTVETVDVQDFVLTQLSSPTGAYQVAYKDGTVETLTPVTSDNSFVYVTEIRHENGYKLTVQYYFRETFSIEPFVERIYDEFNNDLLSITRRGNEIYYYVDIEVYKNKPSLTNKLTLVVSGNFRSITQCQVALSPTIDILTFNYAGINSCRVITQVTSNFFGEAIETINYSSDILAPSGAPFASLPTVKLYTFSMSSLGTGATKTEKHEYSYGSTSGSNNFLGYNGVSSWDDNAIDNIYSCPSGYIYEVTEKFFLDDVALYSKKYTYDKFHRLIRSNFVADHFVAPVLAQEITVKNTYNGSTSLDYTALPRTYKLPVQIKTDYKETDLEDSHLRTTTFRSEYDSYGNIISSSESGKMKLRYTYYSSSGAVDNCPPDPHGFVRHLSSIERYQNDISIDGIVSEYFYTSVSNKDNYPYTVLSNSEERKITGGRWNEGYKVIWNEYYKSTASENFNRGRLKSTTLRLSQMNGTTVAFNYTLSSAGDEITTATTQIGWDNSTLTYSETAMSLTGWPTKLKDALDVITEINYDSFGRSTSVTRAKGTDKESTTTYRYEYDRTTKCLSKTTNAPEVNAVTEIYDAMGNVVKLVASGQNLMVAEFDTQGQLLLETHYDYNVPLSNRSEGNLSLTDSYIYDVLGNPRQANYHDGFTKYSRFNIGDAQLIEYTTVSEQNTKFNYEMTDFDPYSLRPVKNYEYKKDGVTVATLTCYYYDTFYRIKDIELTDSTSTKSVKKTYAYDFFDRPNLLTETGQEESEVRTTKINYWPYGLEPKVESTAIDDTTIGYLNYDGLGRLTQEDRNPNQLDRFVTRYEYEAGYTVASKKTTPRNRAIQYTYFPEFDSLPATITMPGNEGKYQYEYNKDTVKLIRETYTLGSKKNIRDITYDQNLNVISETVTDGFAIGSYKNEFLRTTSGRIKKMIKSSAGRPSQTINYSYDSAGRVSKIYINYDERNDLEISVFYLAGDLPSDVSYIFKQSNRNDQVYRLELSYDHQLRVINKVYSDTTGKVLAHHKEEFNGFGNVIKKDIFTTPANSTITTYDFDYLGRLITADISNLSTAYPTNANGYNITWYKYIYDKFNNISSCRTVDESSSNTTITDFTYAGKNPFELIRISQSGYQPSLPVMLSYDESGNIITKSTGNRSFTYAYDSFEKLAKVFESNRTVSFQSNSEGSLGSEELSVEDVRSRGYGTSFGYSNSIFDTSWRKQATSTTNEHIASYIHTPAGVDTMNVLGGGSGSYTKTQTLQFSDRLGGVFGEIDGSLPSPGEVTPLLYSPYGYIKDAEVPAAYDPIRFAGARYDDLTKLYHLGNGTRAYDSSLMRFMQYDAMSPFGKGGINPYNYCICDPITYSDLSGQGRDVAIMFASLGLVLSIFSFGLGALALLGSAPLLLSGIALAGGVLGVAGAATGLAATLVEDDNVAQQLTIASAVLGGAGILFESFPAIMFIGHRVTWRLAQKYSTSRVIQINTGFQKVYPGANYTISGKFMFNGRNTRMVKAHGNIDSLAVPVEVANNPGRWVDQGKSVEEFANFTRTVLNSTALDDSDSAIFLAACGGSPAGARNNAQNLATALNRSVYAFPSRKIFSIVGGTFTDPKITVFGTPWFMKLKQFNPGVAMGEAIPMFPLA
ncbi:MULTISPECIES: RHS repeat-associated core domain-containing protein [Enterobacterales]|uniref:RHS repeat-associated core domain-containing protein n=1 Tax=Enterobacterales TaxID=91347 RepID=UPI002EDB31FE